MQKKINKIIKELKELKEENSESFTMYAEENEKKIQNAIDELKNFIL